MSKIKTLKAEYDSSELREKLSLIEFIRHKSNDPSFWPWFLNRECKDGITDSDKRRFYAFIKLVEKNQIRGSSCVEMDNRINFKISSQDRKLLTDRAKKLGLSVSEYIRKTALNKKITVKTDVEMLMQVRKIGVNINQIARKINKDPSSINIGTGLTELENYMRYLQNILDKIG